MTIKSKAQELADSIVLSLSPNTNAMLGAHAAAIACGMLLGASVVSVTDDLIVRTVRGAESATLDTIAQSHAPVPASLDDLPF